jgi:hypothetical protein
VDICGAAAHIRLTQLADVVPAEKPKGKTYCQPGTNFVYACAVGNGMAKANVE